MGQGKENFHQTGRRIYDTIISLLSMTFLDQNNTTESLGIKDTIRPPQKMNNKNLNYSCQL